ncbi:hypothetical protein thsps117_40300 [Pseudomonas sp. No.117]
MDTPTPYWLASGLLAIVAATMTPAAQAALALLEPQAYRADGQTLDVGGDAAHGYIEVTKKLAAGEPFYLFARGTATSDTTGNLMLGLRIACGDEYLWSTRNHEGNDAYSNPRGQLQEDVRYLFVPASAGTYTCKLQGRNLKGDGALSSNSWTLLSGDSNTYLSWASGLQGAAWGTENDESDFALAQKAGRLGDAGSQCRNRAGDDVDDDQNTTTCCRKSVHLSLKLPAGSNEYALRSARWTPAPGVTSIKAIGDIEMTVCYDGTGSCPEYAYGTPDQKGLGSVVNSRLVVYQMSTGSSVPCATSYYPSSGFQRTAITTDAHHQKIYHTLDNVPVSSSCGADSYFLSKVEVNLVSGNPIRIEGSRYSQNMLLNN